MGPKLQKEMDELLKNSRQIEQLPERFDSMISSLTGVRKAIEETRFTPKLLSNLNNAFESIERQGLHVEDICDDISQLSLLWEPMNNEEGSTVKKELSLINAMDNIESIDNAMKPIIEELQNIKNKISENE